MKSSLAFNKHSWWPDTKATKETHNDYDRYALYVRVTVGTGDSELELGEINKDSGQYQFVPRKNQSTSTGYNPYYQPPVLSEDELTDIQEYIAGIPALFESDKREKRSVFWSVSIGNK